MANRRSRILVCRLTEQEYADLAAACLHRGGRTLSDFVRGALMGTIRSDPHADRMAAWIAEFNGKLAEMQHTLRRANRLLERLAGKEEPANKS